MRCEHVRERVLEALLAGEEEIPVGLRPHVDACADCVAEVERLRRGVMATRVIPYLSVDPPAGMKARVFAAIESAPSDAPAKPAEARPVRTAEKPTLLRGRFLRVLPAAAAVAVLCIGLALVARDRISDAQAQVLISRVEKSQALTDCDELADSLRSDPARWGGPDGTAGPSGAPDGGRLTTHQKTVEEARLALQRVVEAKRNPRDVAAVRDTVKAKRLVDSFRRLVNDCPDPGLRARAARIQDVLQDIEELDRK
jgi:hypothetical protein